MKIPNFGENVYKQVICGGKKVGKWLRLSCVINYDERGNEIHSKDSNGDEWWFEYDERGNVIHGKDSNGHEWWYEYDERGNEIHSKFSDGDEWWREIEYDENGIKRTVLIFYGGSKKNQKTLAPLCGERPKGKSLLEARTMLWRAIFVWLLTSEACFDLYNVEGYEEKEIASRCVSKTPSCNSKSALAKTRKNAESCKSAG